MTKYADRIRISLLLLRLGVFLVITMWGSSTFHVDLASSSMRPTGLPIR